MPEFSVLLILLYLQHPANRLFQIITERRQGDCLFSEKYKTLSTIIYIVFFEKQQK